MAWFSAIVVFVISWWMILLALLPVGVKGQHEAGDPQDGTEPGAPQDPMLKKKFFWATCGALVVTLLAFLISLTGIIHAPDVQW